MSSSSQRRLSRRDFIGTVAAGTAGLTLGCGDNGSGGGTGGGSDCTDGLGVRAVGGVDGAGLDAVSLPGEPFGLGVASGDPTHDRVILWTRLWREADDLPASAIPVTWEIAEDAEFTQILGSGVAAAEPDWAHSVHVDVGGLPSNRWFWYRFRAGDFESPVGRTRTSPCPDAATERLRFAVATCQNYPAGFYHAHHHLAAEDIDLVFFVGDYIYESAGFRGEARAHDPRRSVDDLAGYRARYTQYRRDPNLQASHAAFPWVVTWDDHEVDNNYCGDFRSGEDVVDPDFLQRRAEAYKAWYEHIPVRAERPTGPDLRIYRDLRFGDLCDFHVLDTRQYRTAAPCGGRPTSDCAPRFAEDATIIGAEQTTWLQQSLRASTTRWHAIPQAVVMATVDLGGPLYNPDQWDGYVADQQRLRALFSEPGMENIVVLTGDIHVSAAGYLTADTQDNNAAPVASEFVVTSVSSGGDGNLAQGAEGLLTSLPQIVYFQGGFRGYLRCEMTRDACHMHYRYVSSVEQAELPPVFTGDAFVVHAGNPVPETAEVPVGEAMPA